MVHRMMMKSNFLAACLLWSLGSGITAAAQNARMIDFTDPTYGARIRQIFNPAGDEHDLYHYRSVFNADNSRMIGIETPKGSKDCLVTLYDGDGKFLKKLFTQSEYNWTLAW